MFLLNDDARPFIFFHWQWFATGFFVLAVIAVVVLIFSKSLPSEVRAALFVLIVLPTVLGVVGSVAALPQRYQVMALRAAFLLCVCLLPALMWYLFLETRKASLLNEFLSNLERLGLLKAATDEDEAIRKRRVESYLQKFEAMYGNLPQEIHADVLNNDYKNYSREQTGGASNLSTAAFPVLLSTLLIALGWLVTLPPTLSAEEPVSNSVARLQVPWVEAFRPTSAPVALAFLGAYFFSLQMLFRRYVLNDLGGTAYVAVSIRIILAVIGIWTLMAIGLVDDSQLLVYGFIIGVFPRILWQIIESTFKKGTKFIVPSMTSQLPVNDLDGLTVWHEARLQEEDIENVPNMATADLVELFLNTRLPPERIIDWTDQAILYTQLGAQGKLGSETNPSPRDKLGMHGIRTATALLQASAASRSQGKETAFNEILQDSKGVSRMPALEASLNTNSNLKLIKQWHGMSDVQPGTGSRCAIGPPDREADQRRGAAATPDEEPTGVKTR
jgi:hypothetical protein